MLRRRSSISSINTSKFRERQIKSVFTKLLFYGKYLVIIAGALGLVFFLLQFFIIKDVDCRTNEGQCPQEMYSLLNFLKGKNALLVSKKIVSEPITNIYPLEKITYKFNFPGKLSVDITGWQSSVPVLSYQVPSFPALSMDIASLSSESGVWHRPSGEILNFLQDKDPVGQKIWAAGKMTPEVVDSSDTRYLYVENPTEDMLSYYYRTIILARKYLEKPQIIIIGSRILLSQETQPDIIINVPVDLSEVETALQSIDYLYTIKKDAKVIDLSFKHPIIK